MVMPLSDDNSDRRSIPWVNYALIAINVIVFVAFQGLGTNEKFTYQFSCVPERIVTNTNEPIGGGYVLDHNEQRVRDPETGEYVERPVIPPTPLTPYLTLLTSMFLHGSIMHIVGNMLFLWIFGDNVEDVLGKGRYIVFYLLTGLLATFAHIAETYAFGGNPTIPSLGASGAISGVLGGYILLFPRKRVMVLMFRFITWVPAWVAIGMWFAFQLISGLTEMGGRGGVAYGAHIGGFLAGLALIWVFAFGRTVPTGSADSLRRGVGPRRPSPW